MKRIFVWSRALCVCVVGWILCQTRCGSPHTTDVSFRVVVFVVPFSMECSTVDGQLTMVLVGLELWLVVVGSEVATVALSLSCVCMYGNTHKHVVSLPFCCCFFSRPCRVVMDGHFFFFPFTSQHTFSTVRMGSLFRLVGWRCRCEPRAFFHLLPAQQRGSSPQLLG